LIAAVVRLIETWQENTGPVDKPIINQRIEQNKPFQKSNFR
jgi:hypothetical protein